MVPNIDRIVFSKTATLEENASHLLGELGMMPGYLARWHSGYDVFLQKVTYGRKSLYRQLTMADEAIFVFVHYLAERSKVGLLNRHGLAEAVESYGAEALRDSAHPYHRHFTELGDANRPYVKLRAHKPPARW